MPTDQDDLAERLTTTLEAVAATTVVAPRELDPVASPRSGPADTRSVPRLAVAAAIVVVLALGAAVAGTSSTRENRLDTATVDGSLTLGGEPNPPGRSGLDAYLIPPRELAGRPLDGIYSNWDVSLEEPSPPPRWERRQVEIGDWTVHWDQQQPGRSIHYRYTSHEDAAIGPPGAWFGLVAPARLDLDATRNRSNGSPAMLNGPDGLMVADLGTVCPPENGHLEFTSGGAAGVGCQRRAFLIGPDYFIEIALPPDDNLDDTVAGLRIGDLDELRASFGDIDGTEDILATAPPPPSMPDPPPPPDTPFCNAWAHVLDVSNTEAHPSSDELIDAMKAAADVAPDDLAQQLRDLAAMWEPLNPADRPSQESTDLMMSIINNPSTIECTTGRPGG